MAYSGHLREDDVISPTHDACLIAIAFTADMPGYRHLKKVRIAAPPLSVVATYSHAIQSLLELVSGQCRPLPDKGFTRFIKFYFDIA